MVNTKEKWGPRLPYKKEEVAELLDQTRWTKDCTWEETLTLCEHMLAFELDAGTKIFSEGELDQCMCVVLRGKVGVFKTDAKHQITEIAKVAAPQSLGEMCLIDGQPRSATAKAETDVLILVLTHENFLKLTGRSPTVANKLLIRIGFMLSQRLRATSGMLVDYLGEAH